MACMGRSHSWDGIPRNHDRRIYRWCSPPFQISAGFLDNLVRTGISHISSHDPDHAPEKTNYSTPRLSIHRELVEMLYQCIFSLIDSVFMVLQSLDSFPLWLRTERTSKTSAIPSSKHIGLSRLGIVLAEPDTSALCMQKVTECIGW